MTSRTLIVLIVASILALSATTASAQQTPADAMRLFASSSDITALIARARAERKPDQANFVQPVVRLAPYTMNLEYRMSGLKAPAAVHEKEAELFFVVEGSGTVVTGGKLHEEKRTNPDNLSGTGIEGGESRRIAKGDVVFVPEKTPHWFDAANGALVMLSLHVPRTTP